MNAHTKIGGKAASLQALMSIVRVKPFVTITVDEVENILISGSLPDDVVARIGSLPRDILYAVRSSGVNEDSADRSWAGVFKTVLDVPHDSIESALRECIRGAIGTREAIAYAQAHGATLGGLGVIVQEMVQAECAGVIFTRNPVGSDGHIVIEAVEGNAEKLVSGHAQPARYYLSDVGDIVHEEHGNGFRLSYERLAELFAHAMRIRDHFGCEQDIEWAYEGSELYINQARPITTLEDVLDDATMSAGMLRSELSRESARLRALGCELAPDVLSNQNIAELLTSHPTRMAHGLFRYLFADRNGAIKVARNEMGYEIGDELNAGFQLLVAGKPMMSVIHDAFTYRIRGIPLSDYCRIIDAYLARIRSDEMLANYPEVGLYDQNPSLQFLTELFGEEKAVEYRQAYDDFFERLQTLELVTDRFCAEEFLPRWENILRELSMPNVPTSNVLMTAGRFRSWCELLRTEACPMFAKVARLGFFAFARVKAKLVERLGAMEGERHLNTLLSVSSTESPNYRFNASLYSVRHGLASLDEVIRHFGHLGEHELEISLPRYRERPELLRTLAGKTGSPFDALDENARKAKLAEVELEKSFGDRWEALKWDIDVARRYLLLREVVKFNYLKGYDILRRLAIAIERSLGWEEGLIFHLDPTEVMGLPRDIERLHDAALLAKAMWEANKRISVPPVVFADDLSVIGRTAHADGTTLRGVGVTNEVREGECVVVTSLSDTEALARLRSGSILVTQNTDPAWSPVIAVVGTTGGLITEIGGLLAHTAICAREQGIASVLNVPNATTVLKTGMRVRVDGPNGIVSILT